MDSAATPQKSTVEQIRARFDADVERFSNLQTGQSATVDAPLALELVAAAAAAVTPQARDLLDLGCGAGNYTLKTLELLPNLNVTLVDLSQPMLERAVSRVQPLTDGTVRTFQGDVRELPFESGSFDLILAAAVLHHLRTTDEWQAVFAKCFDMLRPGGSFWIFDLVESSIPEIQSLQWQRYGDYLTDFKGEQYRDDVFAYIAQEDSPRPLMFQLDLLREVGFRDVDLLHQNGCFAAFGGRK